MPYETSDRLLEFAKQQLGDSLRAIVILHDDSSEAVYVRDDLMGEYSQDQYQMVVNTFRFNLQPENDNISELPVGDRKSIIHYHEGAFVFQFPHEECHSILMSVEPVVGSRLESFISECEKRI